MKRFVSNILTGVVGLAGISTLWSCVAETPFENEGEGTVRLTTVVNSIITRADEAAADPLRENCVVYISNEKGLIYKEKGLDNVKESFSLKAGHYIAEAWTGDSVSASFDKKFYRGYEPFDVTKGGTSNVVINCKIANVVASINTSTIDPNLMKDDYTITIKNSKGELTFNKDNASYEKGFFMMPNGETELEYTIHGTNMEGVSFDKTGKIENVKSAHNYILNFEYNPTSLPQETPGIGGVMIKINIKAEEITDNKIETFNARPTITSFRYNLDKQLVFVNDEDIPEKLDLQICGFNGLKYIHLSSESAAQLGWPADVVDIMEATPNAQKIKDSGVEVNIGELNPQTNVITATVSFHKALIEKLSASDIKEHIITVAVEDEAEPYEPTEVKLRIVRNENAIVIEDPVVVDKIDPNADFMSITPHSFTVSYSLTDDFEGTPGVEYSKADEDNWTFVAATTPSATPSKMGLKKAAPKHTIKITGLQPGTTYKYRAACGDFHGDDIMRVTTEEKFIIPNASMEDWSDFKDNSKILLPGAGGERTFWDSGNHGSATMSVTLTQGSTDFKHTGSKSAKLRSQFVGLGGLAGKFAAGNLFAGKYLETQGTDGRLEFGRPYNGSHPVALRVWVNYRPQPADKNGCKNGHLAKGELDEGQIYVALSTLPVEVRTKASNQKLFNKDDDEILAYGQYTFNKVNYGEDGQLKELIIPIDYNTRAYSNKPEYLVIVCSASKYGDFFDGGEGSTMYVDDFELIYE